MKHLTIVLTLSLSGFFFGLTSPSAAPSSSQKQTQHLDAFLAIAPAPAVEMADRLPPGSHPALAKTDSLLSYARKLIGRAYVYGDTGKKGFDCSGFTTHVFSRFGINISRSSTGQATDGRAISRDKARKGDLIVFTGTNPSIRTPGHVGIIISDPGEPIAFVHSSSVGGVKISEVENTGYERRFLEVRRLL
jgi:cell wall-associated NlpC family hydrolase